MSAAGASSDVETGSLLGQGYRASAAAVFPWSSGDWIAMCILFFIGFQIDAQPPFERPLTPQVMADPTISFPHTPIDQQQIPTGLLWRLTLVLPAIILVILTVACPLPRGVPNKWWLLSEMLLGLLSSVGFAFVLVCFIKVRVGRLRPDFVARCAPTNNRICTGAANVVAEGRKSFPSGHSALSYSGLTFVSLVLAAMLMRTPTPRLGRMWKAMVISLPWLLALHVALSRLQDFWHHWQDVLVGTLIGNAAACLSFHLRFTWASLTSGAGLLPRGGVPKEHTSPKPAESM